MSGDGFHSCYFSRRVILFFFFFFFHLLLRRLVLFRALPPFISLWVAREGLKYCRYLDGLDLHAGNAKTRRIARGKEIEK